MPATDDPDDLCIVVTDVSSLSTSFQMPQDQTSRHPYPGSIYRTVYGYIGRNGDFSGAGVGIKGVRL